MNYEEYKPAIRLGGSLAPSGSGTFPIARACDILMPDESRLDDYLANMGDSGGESGDDSTDDGTIDYTTVWEIIDKPDTSSLPQTYAERIQISFTCNRKIYSGIKGDGRKCLFYYLGSSSKCVYDGEWQDEDTYRTITIHEEITDTSFLDWLYQNATLLSGSVDGIITRDGDKTDKMPTIRFVGFRNIFGKFMFSVEIIGGGKLHLGDYLELCAMRTCKRPESDRRAWQKRQRLRKLHGLVIKDTSKNLLTLAIPHEEAGQLFKNDRNGTEYKIGCRSPIYLRIKRPFFDDNGNENYAKFSNVIRLEKSYSMRGNTITIK